MFLGRPLCPSQEEGRSPLSLPLQMSSVRPFLVRVWRVLLSPPRRGGISLKRSRSFLFSFSRSGVIFLLFFRSTVCLFFFLIGGLYFAFRFKPPLCQVKDALFFSCQVCPFPREDRQGAGATRPLPPGEGAGPPRLFFPPLRRPAVFPSTPLLAYRGKTEPPSFSPSLKVPFSFFPPPFAKHFAFRAGSPNLSEGAVSCSGTPHGLPFPTTVVLYG